MNEHFAVYIMSNKPRGTLYTGSTSDLIKRVWEHKNKVVEGFTNTYDLNKLVYYELTSNPEAAVQREKRLKHWNRAWKIELIESVNPDWNDLYAAITGTMDPPVKPEERQF